ncbi:hypothetical protein MRB53_034502 [Persea americana]|uniref:Uncharacterized protein n=1 Tax=Persea americana TaxID=3435 RepID=A0ACC2K206_PERAE|nr:hypothetical protein MRB53_034502 [Persea americana]
MEAEETLRIEVPSSVPIILELVKEMLILEESIPTPLVHEGAVENGQSQLEETSEARLPVQEGDKMVRLPSTEFGDTPVQEETVDPSINNEGIWAEELPTATDIEEVTLESPIQSSEVQDQSPLESSTQLEAGNDPSNTVASELLVVPGLPLRWME